MGLLLSLVSFSLCHGSNKTEGCLGANRGIGLNLVRRLVKHGWTVSGSIRPQSRKDASALDVRLAWRPLYGIAIVLHRTVGRDRG